MSRQLFGSGRPRGSIVVDDLRRSRASWPAPRSRLTGRRSAARITLLGVLIAVAVLTVDLMGLAGLQLTTKFGYQLRDRKMGVQQRGFTLIELLVTVAMVSIVLTLGVPAFRDLVQNNRLNASTNELVGALNLTRSEAVKRGVRVTVCKSATGAACANSGNWEQGWIVFTDIDNNASYDSVTETRIRVREGIGGNVTMIGNTNVGSYISYLAGGHSAMTGGGFQAGTIKICDNRVDSVGRNLVISLSGRIRTEAGISCP